MSIEEIATKRYLYSPGENKANRDHSVDARLQNLEALMGPIWPRLTNGFLPLENNAVRKALSLFVATLYNRHPLRIKDLQAIHDQFVEALDQLPKDENGNPNVSHVELKGKQVEFDASGWQDYKCADKLYFQKSFAGNILANSGGIAELLLQKRWTIVVSDEPVFATCDNPLVLSNSNKPNFGFRTPGTTIHLPLSPTRF